MSERVDKLIGPGMEMQDLSLKAVNKMLALIADQGYSLIPWIKEMKKMKWKEIESILLRTLSRNACTDDNIFPFMEDLLGELKAPKSLIELFVKDEDIVDVFELSYRIATSHPKKSVLVSIQCGLLFNKIQEIIYREERNRKYVREFPQGTWVKKLSSEREYQVVAVPSEEDILQLDDIEFSLLTSNGRKFIKVSGSDLHYNYTIVEEPKKNLSRKHKKRFAFRKNRGPKTDN